MKRKQNKNYTRNRSSLIQDCVVVVSTRNVSFIDQKESPPSSVYMIIQSITCLLLLLEVIILHKHENISRIQLIVFQNILYLVCDYFFFIWLFFLYQYGFIFLKIDVYTLKLNYDYYHFSNSQFLHCVEYTICFTSYMSLM